MDPETRSRVSEKRVGKCGGTEVPGVTVSIKIVLFPPLRDADSSIMNLRWSYFLLVEILRLLFKIDGSR
jgi:hypothetical protein